MRWTFARTSIIVLLATGAFTGSVVGSPPEYREAVSHTDVIRDWMLQDYMSILLPRELERRKREWKEKHLTARESAAELPVLRELACFESDRDSIVEQKMLARVLEELGDGGAAIRADVDSLIQGGAPGRDPRWRELYVRACEKRRARRLAPLLKRWTRFVFNQHHHFKNSWKYTEMLSDARSDRHRDFRPGATLNVLEMVGAYGKVRTLIDDPHGILRNPDVSFDGTEILFAWKKSDRQDDFHLYEMNAATGNVRQITHGLGFADYEGVYLPDGNILFSSTRCVQSVPCNWVEVSNLYVTDASARYLRRIGFDQVHTIFPSVTDDGRVLYTRWEYSDRGQIYPQPLFQMYPDGTSQREFYGASSWFPTNIIHARKIPGSGKVLAVVTGHHRPGHGKLGIIDPAQGRQEGRGVQLIAPVRRTPYVRVDRYALEGNQYQYPYPLDDEHFLVTLALPTPDGKLGRFDIYFMDTNGRRELLVAGKETGEGLGCRQIIPLAPRPRPHVRPNQVDYRKTTGTFYVQDVYAGPGLEGIPRGTIKRLRVVALEYRAAAIGRLRQKGPGGDSEVTTPIAIGNGSWDVKVVLGSATVHEDGSAFFEAPARIPLYFQALDAKNRVVQSMRSWTTLMPGELQSCVGCHDHKNETPRPALKTSLALRAGLEKLDLFYGPPRGFSFPREIQPILDRNCIRCHPGDNGKSFSLRANRVHMKDMNRYFSESYLWLTNTEEACGDPNHPMVNWIDSMSEPTMLPPYHRGAATSRLVTLLEAGHEGVELSREEMDKIACWIDLLVPYCGEYLEASVWTERERDLYARYAKKRQRMEAEEQANIRAWITR